MAQDWTEQRERSTRFFLKLMVWIARHAGRRPALAVLRPVTLYYLVTAPRARVASRSYLRRVLSHEPGWGNVYRHFLTFATTLVDRVYALSGDDGALRITVHGRSVMHRYRDEGTGAILMLTHLGSFELMRVLARDHGGLPLRALMNRAAGAKANAVFDAINPDLRAMLIDTSESDVDRILKVQAALERGEIVALMADRHRPGERTVECDFLGGRAPFPLSPWLLAGVVRVPVVLGFGLYRGGAAYELHFEEFSPRLELPRRERDARAQDCARAYADRVGAYARHAPYNWFNFYEFWNS